PPEWNDFRRGRRFINDTNFGRSAGMRWTVGVLMSPVLETKTAWQPNGSFRIARLGHNEIDFRIIIPKGSASRTGSRLGSGGGGLFVEMEHVAELLQSQGDFGRSGARHSLHTCYSFLHVRGLSGQA